jgi:2-polyprenyl-6-methoxyphenol hydroxylase-like FAD-dependent oxidoreductase
MKGRRVVIGASAAAVLALAGTAVATLDHSTTTPPSATATVSSCARDGEGFVRVSGALQNLTDSTVRVEVTVGVFDAATDKQVDYTQAKSSPLGPGRSETYTAAVYNLAGENSIPTNITIKCRVTAVTTNEVG